MTAVLNGSTPGGSGLPAATGANQLPVSSGAGTAYNAISAGDAVGAGLVDVLGGEAAGTAIVSDGAGDVTMTSTDVSAMLAAANNAAILAAIGAGAAASHTSGTLAARPASPAAGDTYAVTSGDGTGDRYTCFVAGAWELVHFDREDGDDTPAMLWRLDEASGTYASQGTYSVPLTVTGALTRDGSAYDGRVCPRLPGAPGIYAASASGTVGISTAPTALTLAAWVLPTAVGGLRSILVCQYDSANTNPYYTGLALTSGAIRALLVKGGAYQEVAGGAVAVTGAWQHVGWSYNEGGDKKVRFYLNGQLLSTSGATSGGAALDLGTTSRWVVGDQVGSLSEYYAGQVASARVYDTAQPLSWWQRVYARGVGAYRGA